MQRVGATEQEKAMAVAMIAKGKDLDDVKTVFANVEAAYWDRNKDDLLILAGKKAKRSATEEERKAAATLLKQKTLDGEPRFESVEALASVFPSVDPKTLKAVDPLK